MIPELKGLNRCDEDAQQKLELMRIRLPRYDNFQTKRTDWWRQNLRTLVQLGLLHTSSTKMRMVINDILGIVRMNLMIGGV